MNHPTTPRLLLALLALTPCACTSQTQSQSAPPPPSQNLKSESFTHDPHWESHNNRLPPKHPTTVTQDFGYSPSTHFASDTPGEIGGRVTRAANAAFYALKLPPTSLNDPLSASGTFAITSSGPASAIFFGFFNSDQPTANGRPTNSLGLELGGEHAGCRLAVHAITASNQTTGTFITRFERYRTPEEHARNRPTPIHNDGTRYAWTLSYDPHASNDRGQVTFSIHHLPNQPPRLAAALARRAPSTTHTSPNNDTSFENKTFTVTLPENFKHDGATFTHFGLLNGTKPGGPLTIFFSNLSLNSHPLDLSKDPHWDSQGNHSTTTNALSVGAHNFGYSPTTHYANGSAPGELGGDFWRASPYAYYADPLPAPLTLNTPLVIRGRVILLTGAPDSDMFLGFFHSPSPDTPAKTANFLGIHVGGPTRVGHYFEPALTTSTGQRPRKPSPEPPVLKPGHPHTFSLSYDPTASAGAGSLTLTLDDTQSTTLPLTPQLRSSGATFNRFGLFTSTTGGQLVRLYLDDLQYTTRPPTP